MDSAHVNLTSAVLIQNVLVQMGLINVYIGQHLVHPNFILSMEMRLTVEPFICAQLLRPEPQTGMCHVTQILSLLFLRPLQSLWFPCQAPPLSKGQDVRYQMMTPAIILKWPTAPWIVQGKGCSSQHYYYFCYVLHIHIIVLVFHLEVLYYLLDCVGVRHIRD